MCTSGSHRTLALTFSISALQQLMSPPLALMPWLHKVDSSVSPLSHKADASDLFGDLCHWVAVSFCSSLAKSHTHGTPSPKLTPALGSLLLTSPAVVSASSTTRSFCPSAVSLACTPLGGFLTALVWKPLPTAGPHHGRVL